MVGVRDDIAVEVVDLGPAVAIAELGLGDAEQGVACLDLVQAVVSRGPGAQSAGDPLARRLGLDTNPVIFLWPTGLMGLFFVMLVVSPEATAGGEGLTSVREATENRRWAPSRSARCSSS
ncbi:MAG TPA: hypothetical protein VK923_19470 [Euzebyales bacterium]|nr:hypothetical protein [Euzebyales bacterium]